MAPQCVNWLRTLELVWKDGDQYSLADAGRRFTDDAIESWTDTAASTLSNSGDSMTAATYETTVETRAIDSEFREFVLARFDHTCPISGVDHSGLLDVAHILF
ncbi:hypothetical protein [Natronococcus occultus]|uniref:hypothetical protein n=1 Tax=Natronococcus occultus TaxID=29288 RepID=UPI000677E719|nr:hypothetical protein [Natronococcus occultus]